MRVLICGDRKWSDEDTMREVISKLPQDTVVIHGACRGADQMAGRLAEEYGLSVEAFPADWARYGRGAGPIRNKQMLVEGRPDRVYAFHNNLAASRGTANMIRQATVSKIEVWTFSLGPVTP